MKILIIDNYDSFTFNLYQLVGEILLSRGQIEGGITVRRNDEITVAGVLGGGYDRIIISPGPGEPSDQNYFGECGKIITQVGPAIPLLGVCLGLQGIAHYFGGRVVRAELPKHGKISLLTHDGRGLFKNLPQQLEVMRYHSLVVEEKSLPDCLEVSAFTFSDGGQREIMGLRHKKFPIEGAQFHPESFATEGGREILKNFLL